MKVAELINRLRVLDPELDIAFQTPDNWIYNFCDIHVGYGKDGHEIDPNEDGLIGTYRIALLSE